MEKPCIEHEGRIGKIEGALPLMVRLQWTTVSLLVAMLGILGVLGAYLIDQLSSGRLLALMR